MPSRSLGSGEEPLQENSEFLQALVRNVSEGLVSIDTDGEILYANSALEGILGYRLDDLVGNPLTKIIPDRLVPAHEAGLTRYLETGEKSLDWTGIELPAQHKDGHEVPVVVSFREHDFEGHRLFTGIITDITEQKHREQRLERQNEKLEEFTHVLSHDLQNPLAVAKGYIELLQEEHEIEEMDEVEQALSRIEAIIEDTQTATVNGEHDGPSEVRTFNEIVRKAWDSVPTKDAELVAPDPVWNIEVTEGCVLQLLENLFRNAVEHGGQSVTVEVGILGDVEGFYVEDDGVGMSDEMKRDLRSANDSADDRSDGYGLEMVERVVEEHGWRMVITDSTTGGARFEFTDVTLFV